MGAAFAFTNVNPIQNQKTISKIAAQNFLRRSLFQDTKAI